MVRARIILEFIQQMRVLIALHAESLKAPDDDLSLQSQIQAAKEKFISLMHEIRDRQDLLNTGAETHSEEPEIPDEMGAKLSPKLLEFIRLLDTVPMGRESRITAAPAAIALCDEMSDLIRPLLPPAEC